MVIREIKAQHWDHVYHQILQNGRTSPLSLQVDLDINCNGVDYILKVQPEKEHKLVPLQVMGIYPNAQMPCSKEFRLIENNAILLALLEIIIYQGTAKRSS